MIIVPFSFCLLFPVARTVKPDMFGLDDLRKMSIKLVCKLKDQMLMWMQLEIHIRVVLALYLHQKSIMTVVEYMVQLIYSIFSCSKQDTKIMHDI